ncbi:MAG: hypothetical protein U0528_19185 [Anaerolineae bacterium]|nr:hypothetical protein [Anaerolineae bacterium]
MTMLERHSTTENPIETAFLFTQDDLKQNRQGRLSPAQIAQLRRKAARLSLPILAIIAALGVLTILSVPAAGDEFLMLLLCLGVPALVTLTLTIGMTEAAVGPSLVTKISGEAHFAYGIFGYDPPLGEQQIRRLKRQYSAYFGYYGSYRMVVGEMEFQLSRDEFQALGVGFYNIYFVPTIRKIVSVEKLDLDPSLPKAAPIRPAELVDPAMDAIGDEELRA